MIGNKDPLGGGVYVVVIKQEGEPDKVSLSGVSYAEASGFAKGINALADQTGKTAEVRKAERVLREDLSLMDFAEQYILERDLRPSSEEQIRISVRHFSSYMGTLEYPLAKISSDEINRYLKDLHQSGRSTETVRSRRRVLLTILNEAYRQRVTEFDDRRVRRIAKKKAIIQCWNRDEVQKLRDVATSWIGQRKLKNGVDEGIYWSTYVSVAWDSSLRRGDIVAIEIDSIAESFWINQQKTGDPVLVELYPQTVEQIKRLAASGPARKCPLEWPYAHRLFFAHAKELINDAGLVGTMKYIRRGVATAIAELTQRSEDAARKLGHCSDDVTKRHYLRQGWQQFPSNLPPELGNGKEVTE